MHYLLVHFMLLNLNRLIVIVAAQQWNVEELIYFYSVLLHIHNIVVSVIILCEDS